VIFYSKACYRLRISLTYWYFGRRNVGKSSLIECFYQSREFLIVSEIAGTTTDPVEKAIEVLPIGPCQIIDTAGIDDEGFWARFVRKNKKNFLTVQI
jgi:predicted GTPase